MAEIHDDQEDEASSMAQDSDYEYDSDGGGAPPEATTQGRWLADHHKRRRWEQREQARRGGEGAAPTAAGLAAAAGATAPRTVFSGAASFKVLAADLLALQHDAEDNAGDGVRIEAEAVEDSVYHWSCRLSRFEAGGPAQKFLGLLERAHGYGHVELDVRFAVDLYPFFPPVVRLVRPRVGAYAMADREEAFLVLEEPNVQLGARAGRQTTERQKYPRPQPQRRAKSRG